MTADWLLTDCWLAADWLVTDCDCLKFTWSKLEDLERWRLSVFDNSVLDTRTDRHCDSLSSWLSQKIASSLSHGTIRTHVTCVTCPETCLKVCQLFGQKSLKTWVIWFDLVNEVLVWVVWPLTFLKIYATVLDQFSKLIEPPGDVWLCCRWFKDKWTLTRILCSLSILRCSVI